MAKLIARYLEPGRTGKNPSPRKVLDIGSCEPSGGYRPLFASPAWEYVGVDVLGGPNVDVVMLSPYRLPFEDAVADIVVSGQAFEHIEFFWKTWEEMVRVLKPGGLIFLIVPSSGREHRYPVDCWRFYPDGLRALAKLGNLEVLEVHRDKPRPVAFFFERVVRKLKLWRADKLRNLEWADTVGAFQKPR